MSDRTLEADLDRIQDLRTRIVALETEKQLVQDELSKACREAAESHEIPRSGVLHKGRYVCLRNKGRTWFPVESTTPFRGR